MDNVVDLIHKAQAGDKNALLKLIMDKKIEYYRLAYVYVDNQEDALDALEDMIVAVYKNIGKLKKPEAYYSWSKTILVNICKSMLKKRSKSVAWEDVNQEPYVESYEQKEYRADLAEHIALLNSNQQEAIKLRYFLDYDYQTIAEIMQVPLGTVKSRISIGLEKLKESLGGDYLW